jgi:hypothetical protein
LPQDGLPQDGLPQDGLPQDGLPRAGMACRSDAVDRCASSVRHAIVISLFSGTGK